MKRTAAAAAVIAALGTGQVLPDVISMAGGLDIVTAAYQRAPGVCRTAQNFEATLAADNKKPGGYRRITGYERFDGQDKPSDATYTILEANISGAPSVGQTLTGASSGATGVIVALPGGGFVLTKVVGTFTNGENLNVGGPTIAVASAAPVINGASTGALHATYRNLAADQYRNDILAVPGSGATLGTWMFDDIVYAFRNNAGGTAAAMYKSTAGGWSLVSFEFEVTYSAGSGAAAIVDGGTLTQGAVTATIRRVLVRTGALAGGTAAGTMVISVPAGGNFGAGAATVGAGTLTLAGIQTAITLLPSGRYEFMNTNFGGGITTKRMYGCDSVNPAFEFDGSYFVPIHTGMTVDAPSHIYEHLKHLFLSFLGSVQHSGPGTPYAWTPVLGAAELGLGDTVTGFMTLQGAETGAALAMFSRNQTKILYGNSSATWNQVDMKKELGAYAHTIQDAGIPMFLDDRGVTDLQATQTFGNFANNAISNQILPRVTEWRTLAVASCVSRDRSQYRIFFTNKYALYITLAGRKVIGIMPMLFEDTVRCAFSLEKNDGSEMMVFGSDDGWVFQMDKGTSFDGDPIDAYIELAYNFQRSPRVLKRYRTVTTEIQGDGYAELQFGYSLGYGSADIAQPADIARSVSFSSTLWDEFVWDNFFWDGVTLAPDSVTVDNEAENISIAYRSNDDEFEPFTITGAVIQYTPRRRMR